MTERVVVTGDREWSDRDLLDTALDEVYTECGGDMVLIEGEARGADIMSREWAKDRKVPVDDYPAKWAEHGRSAGPRRNQQMIDEGNPTQGVVFHHDLANSRGTADMVKRLEKALVPLRFVPGDNRPDVQLKMDA